MKQQLASGSLADHDQMLVAYALGITLDQFEMFAAAFAATEQANQIQHSISDYSTETQRSIFERHKGHLGREFLDQCRGAGLDTSAPILVVGMPRSGTSLIEQILAGHPSVYGAGETTHSSIIVEGIRKLTGKSFPSGIENIAPEMLAQFGAEYVTALQAHDRSARFITDKLPHNFLRLGFFLALMPDVKIVLCERDPLDNCLSIYQHYFVDEHGYACDFGNLGHYYALYSDIVEHWTSLASGQILRVSYEELVRDPEPEIRRLLAHCDLDVHPDCLSFYEAARVVVTPSASQVRKPIYRSAVGRSGDYAEYLGPLELALEQKN